jgi:Flp pilus assembly protein TadG
MEAPRVKQRGAPVVNRSRHQEGGIMIPFKNSQRGQSLVEFALLLPVFVFLLFGIIEFGRLWEVTGFLSSAAREAARIAAVTSPDVARAEAAARNVLSAAHIYNPTIWVSGPNASNEVTVTVSTYYTPITGSVIPGLGPFSVRRSTTMRWER